MGTGWYRKSFKLPGGARGHEVWLEFDGVYMNSDVWINGVHLGHRPYGYISFAYDITDQLVRGVNVVAVRVDNSRQPSSRWYTGSGIYRHVWLSVVDPLHVGHWGTYLTTPRADSGRADVLARTVVENGYRTPRRGDTTLDGCGQRWARSCPGGSSVFPACGPEDRIGAAPRGRHSASLVGRDTPSLHPPLYRHRRRSNHRRAHHDVRHPQHRVRQGSRVPAQRSAGQDARRQPAPRCRRARRGRPGTGLAPPARRP